MVNGGYTGPGAELEGAGKSSKGGKPEGMLGYRLDDGTIKMVTGIRSIHALRELHLLEESKGKT